MKSINVKNIGFSYKKGNAVFKEFSLSLLQDENEGKITAIMGASGSGKSTLMKLLLGIEKTLTGSIEMQPANPVFSYVPQEAVLFEHLSIQDNARYFEFAGSFKKRFNQELYNELVRSMELEDVLDAKKSVLELSGGQKQRLCLLRALSIEPDFLLLDEPCNGLDAEVKRAFLNKLREITQRYGLFVLYITHHKSEAKLIADEVVYFVQDIHNGIVSYSVQDTVQAFMEKPPVMQAAQVFRFPDIKLLPICVNRLKEPVIAVNEDDITHYWLVDDENITICASEGFPFRLISKSPIYAVVRHEESKIEWILPTMQLKEFSLGEIVYIKIDERVAVYAKNGLLIN